MKAWSRVIAPTCILLAACGDDPGGSEEGGGTEATDGATTDASTGDPAGDGTWTVFVYGHADHNLSPSLVADIGEMSNAMLSEDVTVVVMADWDASNPDYASGSVGIQDGDGTPVLAIPGYVRADGDQAEAALPFQATDTTVDSAVIWTGIDTTSVLPLQYLAGVEFVPIVPTLRVSTGEIELLEGTPIAIPDSGVLELGTGAAVGGDYMLITSVLDVWGNFEPVADLVSLP